MYSNDCQYTIADSLCFCLKIIKISQLFLELVMCLVS